MIALKLPDLLKRALKVGALEVRLIPGRRTVVVTEKGQNEVRGEPQTSDKINALLEEVLTPEARRGLASGYAAWQFELPGRGPVRATAELKMGQVRAAFVLDGCERNGQQTQEPQPKRAIAPRKANAQAVVPLAIPAESPTIDVMDAEVGATANNGSPANGLRARDLSGPAFAPTEPSAASTVSVMQSPAPAGTPATHHVASAELESRLEPELEGSTQAIDSLLMRLLESQSSDLHISSGAPPMLRSDGDMVGMLDNPSMSHEQVREMLWPIVPARNRDEFVDRHDTDFAYELSGRARFRVNLFLDLKGMGAVFRVIPSKVLTIDDLNLPKELLSLCYLPKGLVLVTGPTGSGKSTTLAALIDYINDHRAAHIITIEDPVEFVHQNKRCLVNQRQVGEHTKSFKAALRAALREDPDIVLLGEMRDLETVSIAMETAETGHLVFGTLHTSSAPATVDRIIDQFPANEQNQIRVMLANSLKGVISQMLCKRIGGGRIAALEVMFGVPAISNLIREAKVFQIPSIIQTNRNSGMRLMNDSLLGLVKDGMVDPEEALNKSNDRAVLTNLFKQHQIRS